MFPCINCGSDSLQLVSNFQRHPIPSSNSRCYLRFFLHSLKRSQLGIHIHLISLLNENICSRETDYPCPKNSNLCPWDHMLFGENILNDMFGTSVCDAHPCAAVPVIMVYCFAVSFRRFLHANPALSVWSNSCLITNRLVYVGDYVR